MIDEDEAEGIAAGAWTVEEDAEPEPKPAFYSVAVYHTTRRFGGYEEGGWWYNQDILVSADNDMIHEHPVLLPRIKRTIDAAICAREEMQAYLDKHYNAGRPCLSSVLSTGRYTACIHDGWPPQCDPMERPTYE